MIHLCIWSSQIKLASPLDLRIIPICLAAADIRYDVTIGTEVKVILGSVGVSGAGELSAWSCCSRLYVVALRTNVRVISIARKN